MHPLIEHLSMFTWADILDTKEKCISFLEDLDLVPKKEDYAPECPKCSSAMSAARAHYAIGWRWHCKNRSDKNNLCLGRVNPLDGTFFQGLRIPITEVVALMFGYIMKMSSVDIKEHLNGWRSRHNVKPMSLSTVLTFYKQFDEIILSCLNELGETFDKKLKLTEKTNREKLLVKYSKALNVQPVFRNLTFQFLMDIKSKYPCFKRKDVPQNINSSVASTSSSCKTTSAEAHANNISSSKTYSDKSTINSTASDSSNPVINPSLISSVRDQNKNSESSKTPNSISVVTSIQTTNAVSNKGSKSANSVPILSEARDTKTASCKRSKTSCCIPDSMKRNFINTTFCKNSKFAKNKTFASEARIPNSDSCKNLETSNSITASTETVIINTRSFKHPQMLKIVYVPSHVDTEKTAAVKCSNSSSIQNSLTKKVSYIRNGLAVASPSTVATITNSLKKNSSSFSDTRTLPEDLNMDIDRVETLRNTFNK